MDPIGLAHSGASASGSDVLSPTLETDELGLTDSTLFCPATAFEFSAPIPPQRLSASAPQRLSLLVFHP